MSDAPRPPSHPLLELTIARLVEFWRDPSALFWTFGFPILLAVALGIAFRESPPESVKAAIVGDGAQETAALLDADEGIDAEAVDEAEAARALRTGKVDVVVVPGGDGEWLYRYDPQRPEARGARLAVDDVLQRSRGRQDVLRSRVNESTGKGGRYIDFLVPGLVGLNIMGSAIWGIGFSVVDARKRKLLKRLAATPMSRAHFLLSYMFSRLVFLVAEVIALLGFGWLAFDVAIEGSIVALALISTWGALTMTGVAMLIAARPRSTEVASGWGNLFMLPMWLLGGSFFSYERFPDVAIPFIRALPLTALNDALRAVINDGASLLSTWSELAVLGAWGGIAFVVALRIFRWQ
jgi:ABC-type multidrug transport system permease subunit